MILMLLLFLITPLDSLARRRSRRVLLRSRYLGTRLRRFDALRWFRALWRLVVLLPWFRALLRFEALLRWFRALWRLVALLRWFRSRLRFETLRGFVALRCRLAGTGRRLRRVAYVLALWCGLGALEARLRTVDAARFRCARHVADR